MSDHTLTIATLNLRHDTDRWQERLPLLVAALAKVHPHLVGLQEVSIRSDEGPLLLEQLNALASERYQLYLQPKMGEEAHEEGIAILSRLPALHYDWLDLQGGSRVAQVLRIPLPGGRILDLYNTHLHHPEEAEALRLAQAERLLAWIEARGNGALPIVVGELNALPESPALLRLKRSLLSAYEVVHGHEPDCTFPTPLSSQWGEWRGTIDYILLAPALATVVRSVRLFADEAHPCDATLYPSDHYGLVAQIDLGF